jgi:transposase InsO family protein
MGVVIQFESHKNELPHIRTLEGDEDVIEFYDQASQIKLNYVGLDGRNKGTYHTPDFFVIRKDSAGWEECKTEQSLLELELRSPNRYRRNDNGTWFSPPGEEHAALFGFYYKIVSSKSINWTFQRNLEFLEDYFRVNTPEIPPSSRESVLAQVSSNFGITLEDLLNCTSNRASRDVVFMMIAREDIYVDLYSMVLPEFKYVRVFASKDVAIAYDHLVKDISPHLSESALCISLESNKKILWDNRTWKVVNTGERSVSLLNEESELVELPISVIETLIRNGQITSDHSHESSIRTVALDHPEVRLRFSQAGSEDLATANYRYKLVRAYNMKEMHPGGFGVSERTLRGWAAEYCKAESSYGCGYIGLLRQPRSGNKNPRLPPESRELMNEYIDKSYENLKQRRRRQVHNEYAFDCEQKHIQPASYTTFCTAIKQSPQKSQKEKRLGKRGAYDEKDFYCELELTSPRHGEYPFHIAHIDHTLADVECVCSYTGKNMGRPWISFMGDSFTRQVLAKYSTYDPPSQRTNMMLIRECVRRHNRLPRIITVDNAHDFSSTYFETLLAAFEITKKVRPVAEPRSGSILERLFGTANSHVFHNLEGNTQIMVNVRQVTKSVNPKHHAIWVLDGVDSLVTRWSYDVYDMIEHSALGQSPREAYEQGVKLFGTRAFKRILYNEAFLMLTMPPSLRGKAKVSKDFIKINHIRYWSDAFKNERVKGTSVLVRMDPWNAGRVYAFVLGRWVEAYSDYYAIFRNRSEREIRLATDELRRRNKLLSSRYKLTARRLAEFLKSVEAEEVLLHQRLADLASRQIAVNSGLLPPTYLSRAAENTTQNSGTIISTQGSLSDQDTSTDSQIPSVSQIYKTI